MRQFLLAGDVAYATATNYLNIAEGAVGVYYLKAGVVTSTADGSDITDKANIVLGRTATNGGPVVLPIYKNNFSFVKGDYKAATTFAGTVTVKNNGIGEYTIIVVHKGVHFNRRNKYTASVYITDFEATADSIATQLAAKVNANTMASGVTATAAGAVVTITANTAGVDYNLVAADRLMDVGTVAITTRGDLPFGDANYITNLASKAAADAGFEYTYRGAIPYKNYPLNPLAVPNRVDTGFTIFTMRFAEPREMKTRDELVHQIVQVAFPTGSAAITTFEAILANLAADTPTPSATGG